jgi:hypothetical protein
MPGKDYLMKKFGDSLELFTNLDALPFLEAGPQLERK